MSHGGVIGAQLTDICTRVSSVRCFAVSEVARMLVDERMASSRSKLESGRIKVLMAAAFIVGEYSEMLGLEKGLGNLGAGIQKQLGEDSLQFVLVNKGPR